jgi:hypothetical protein
MTACAIEISPEALAAGPPAPSAGPGPLTAARPTAPSGAGALAGPRSPAPFGVGGPPGPAGPLPRTGFTVSADGSYAACLADAGEGAWYPERWTLGGPEPYTVPLPGNQPEEPDSQVLPLPDGRVLICRGSAGRYDIALLYPAGHGTGELPVCFLYAEEVRLLPAPGNGSAYALGYAAGRSTVWLVHGGPGLERRAEMAGRCAGGVWLDRGGRVLALDREREGRTKTVAVDLCTGEVNPLLEIAEDSDDRLLMADPDSGLLLLRSDAPGTDRLGWGVLGSSRPVRFPECLRDDGPGGGRLEPVAVQPGHLLMPESCAVVLRDGGRSALWRPSTRRLDPLPTPPGWLAGSAWWPEPGTLRLPYARVERPCGVRDVPTGRDGCEWPREAAPDGTAGAGRTLTRIPVVAPVCRVIPLHEREVGTG